jgi:hypothetical protein
MDYSEIFEFQEDSTDENWEQVSQEACQWSLLIGKLDEIAVLNTIIRSVHFSISIRKMEFLKFNHSVSW